MDFFFYMCFKEQQDCGCSNWEDKPGAKGDHSTGIVLVIKVTFPLYLSRAMLVILLEDV
uniref:Uncharacterized protein n=1 Tax=Anser cygnoides TaxID=8845 RepID=A0A8B9DPL5_ANSCY